MNTPSIVRLFLIVAMASSSIAIIVQFIATEVAPAALGDVIVPLVESTERPEVYGAVSKRIRQTQRPASNVVITLSGVALTCCVVSFALLRNPASGLPS